MLTSCIVTFDANGGSVDKTEQTVYYGQPYGTLPVPTLQYYKFVGWFTEADGGTQIKETTPGRIAGQPYALCALGAGYLCDHLR